MTRRDARRAVWRDGIRSRAAKPSSIRVHIDELRVVGFPASAARRIADGVQREMSLRAASRGVPPEWIRARAIDSATAGRVPVHQGMSSQGLGAQVAQAVLDMRVEERR